MRIDTTYMLITSAYYGITTTHVLPFTNSSGSHMGSDDDTIGTHILSVLIPHIYAHNIGILLHIYIVTTTHVLPFTNSSGSDVNSYTYTYIYHVYNSKYSIMNYNTHHILSTLTSIDNYLSIESYMKTILYYIIFSNKTCNTQYYIGCNTRIFSKSEYILEKFHFARIGASQSAQKVDTTTVFLIFLARTRPNRNSE